jgi:YlmC/YmxH family sporulation protein
MRLSELRQKDIINTCTCSNLGSPVDLEFDPKTGCITALVAAAPGRFCGLFLKDQEVIIPWNCICQIGEDIILAALKDNGPPPR